MVPAGRPRPHVFKETFKRCFTVAALRPTVANLYTFATIPGKRPVLRIVASLPNVRQNIRLWFPGKTMLEPSVVRSFPVF